VVAIDRNNRSRSSECAAKLGFRLSELKQGWSDTANGKVAFRLATLASMDVQEARVEDVSISFIDDEKLVGPLLGMSFLGKFSLTLDDEHSRIILVPR